MQYQNIKNFILLGLTRLSIFCHCEGTPEAIQIAVCVYGLLRYARNDTKRVSPACAFLFQYWLFCLLFSRFEIRYSVFYLLRYFALHGHAELLYRPTHGRSNDIDAEEDKRPHHHPREHFPRFADFLGITLGRNKFETREHDKEHDENGAILNRDIDNGEEERRKIREFNRVA